MEKPQPQALGPVAEQRQQLIVSKQETPESDIAKRAREGDLDAIREILRNVSQALDCATNWSLTGRETIRKRRPMTQSVACCLIPWPYAEYVAEALQKASNANLTELTPAFRKIEAINAVQLLGLKRGNRGRPKGTKFHVEAPLAALYWLAIKKGYHPATAKKLLQKLLLDVATVDRRTIEKAAKRNSHLKQHADALLVGIISAAPTYSRALKALCVRPPGK